VTEDSDSTEQVHVRKPGTRLNKYVALSGIGSRRKADEFIKDGAVTVNDVVITEMGFKVQPNDEVKFNGVVITQEKKVYILLNKPKNVITTTDDPQGRRTVIDMIKDNYDQRVYPVGRLDRNTTGLLLITNDGELSQKLAHPSYEVRKLYSVELDKELTQKDFDAIKAGVLLEEGTASVDDLSYVAGGENKIIGIKIHMGWNRVVRRIFEKLGYEVLKLDRVMYANLTKKDLPRSRWRELTEKEIIALKYMNIK